MEQIFIFLSSYWINILNIFVITLMAISFLIVSLLHFRKKNVSDDLIIEMKKNGDFVQKGDFYQKTVIKWSIALYFISFIIQIMILLK